MARTRRRLVGALLAVAVGVAGLTAGAAAATAPVKRNLVATGTALAFSRATLNAPAGPVKLVLTNRSGTYRHNVALKGASIRTRKGPVVGKGGVSTLTIRLAPGRYTYFCSVGKHAERGMTGVLRIT